MGSLAAASCNVASLGVTAVGWGGGRIGKAHSQLVEVRVARVSGGRHWRVWQRPSLLPPRREHLVQDGGPVCWWRVRKPFSRPAGIYCYATRPGSCDVCEGIPDSVAIYRDFVHRIPLIAQNNGALRLDKREQFLVRDKVLVREMS